MNDLLTPDVLNYALTTAATLLTGVVVFALRQLKLDVDEKLQKRIETRIRELIKSGYNNGQVLELLHSQGLTRTWMGLRRKFKDHHILEMIAVQEDAPYRIPDMLDLGTITNDLMHLIHDVEKLREDLASLRAEIKRPKEGNNPQTWTPPFGGSTGDVTATKDGVSWWRPKE